MTGGKDGGKGAFSPHCIHCMQDKFSSAWAELEAFCWWSWGQGDFSEAPLVLWFHSSTQELLKHMWHKSPYGFNFLYYVTVFAYLCTDLPYSKFVLCWAPSATE